MASKAFNVTDGLSVGANANIIIYPNGHVVANSLQVDGISNLGPVGNVIITGGGSGQVLSTDGNGVLSWTTQSGGAGNLVAPMPYYIATACSYTVSSNFQGLFSQPIEIDGNLEVDGVLIQVEGALTTDNGQILFNLNGNLIGDSNLVFNQSNTTLVVNNFVSSTSANLGSVSNVKITGGTNGYYLQTDGAGNLTWAPGGGGGNGTSIANGTSNVSINTANGNITFSANGNANVMVISGSKIDLGSNSNVSISGGSANYVLTTDGAGNLSWSAQTGGNGVPGGFNTYVQFNDSGNFAGSSKFLFNKVGNTLTVSNLNIQGNANVLSFTNGDGNAIKFIVPNTATDTTFIVPNASGTSQQVLGVTNQSTQQLGWKTLPTNYVSVELRDTTTYISSITPVLRVLPLRLRNGTFLNLPTA